MGKRIEVPFVFGVRVEGDAFTDRREETARLKANFMYGVNTILISPWIFFSCLASSIEAVPTILISLNRERNIAEMPSLNRKSNAVIPAIIIISLMVYARTFGGRFCSLCRLRSMR